MLSCNFNFDNYIFSVTSCTAKDGKIDILNPLHIHYDNGIASGTPNVFEYEQTQIDKNTLAPITPTNAEKALSAYGIKPSDKRFTELKNGLLDNASGKGIKDAPQPGEPLNLPLPSSPSDLMDGIIKYALIGLSLYIGYRAVKAGALDKFFKPKKKQLSEQ